ncbi:MAG: glycosyltransferase family 9 protein [Planctomycetes bacterium]|nr:glycosyltransferase family 9 protein [Planctomycetota bacterium]
MLALRAMPAAPPTALEPALPGQQLLPRGGRVLIVRLSALGDVLFALETVAALHHERPDVAIDFLVEDRFASLLQDHPQIERVLVYPRKRRLAIVPSLLALRRTRYDVVIDLHGILKSALHVLFARARTKLGADAPAAREGSQRAYHRAVAMPTPLPHRADIGHLLLRELGLSGQPRAPVLATLAPPADLFAGLPQPIVMLHPGTSAFAAFKRWPVEHFATLAQRLTARGLGVVVGFGPGEADLAAPILAAAPGARGLDGSKLGLRGLAGAMQHAAVVVAADTGPLHIAAATGARCVALFGPKEPGRYGPRAHNGITHELLYHDVPCRPCKRRDCVTPQCVLGIPVEAVEAAVLRQLAARGRA